MPRNSSGTFSLAVAAFVPGGLIKSSDLNADFSDIATALTQSLATTGVSVMTGPIKAFPGTAAAPGMTFNGAGTSGFYLAGTNQIGWSAAGAVGATFNADTSVTFNGTISANKGTIPIGAVVDFAGATPPSGWLLCFGQLVSTTTYASLFTALSTTYGSGAGTFGIPDYRGRATFGQDNMGGSAANRITVAGGNYDGTILGNPGGGQNQTLSVGQLPGGITSVGTTNFSGTIPIQTAGGAFGNGNANATAPTLSVMLVSNPVTAISSASASVTSNNTGGGSHPILSPSIITNKIVYAGV